MKFLFTVWRETLALLKFGKIDDQPKICQLFIILFLHIYLQPVNTFFVLVHSLALVAVVNVNTQGSVSPPCGKMDEYCQCPVTTCNTATSSY